MKLGHDDDHYSTPAGKQDSAYHQNQPVHVVPLPVKRCIDELCQDIGMRVQPHLGLDYVDILEDDLQRFIEHLSTRIRSDKPSGMDSDILDFAREYYR